MLADFPVAIGEYTVICRDVPTAVFFFEFPDTLTASPKAQIAWMMGLLTRVTVDPELSLEHVYRLDESALEAVVGYQHTVGWIDDGKLLERANEPGEVGRAARRYRASIGALADERLIVGPAVMPRYHQHHRPFVGEIPTQIRGIVRRLAAETHTRPSLLWQSPISEFLLDYRIVLADTENQRRDVLTGDDALIGFEK